MDLESFVAQLESSLLKKTEEEIEDDLELPDLEVEDISEDEKPVKIHSFQQFYETICNRIRSSGIVSSIQEEFESLSTDYQRVSYVDQLPETRELEILDSYEGKDENIATDHEETYDGLVSNESMAQNALREIQYSIKFTCNANQDFIKRRYAKRGWANLLLEKFASAEIDANRSLQLKGFSPSEWLAYEILGHCFAKKEEFKKSETNFKKALNGLRKSDSSQRTKATAASRIAIVFKNIKGKKDANKKKSKKNTIENLLPKVTSGQHRTLTKASEVVSLAVNVDRGRSLIANKDIEPGDILIVENPYAASLNPTCFESHCCSCFIRLPVTAVPCSKCSSVWFCDEKCRNNSCDFHETECCIANMLEDEAISKMANLVLRILFTEKWDQLKKNKERLMKILNNESNEKPLETDQWKASSYGSVFQLVTNENKRTFGDLFQRSIMAVFLGHLLRKVKFFPEDEEDRLFVTSLILRHLQGASCNAYGIEEYLPDIEESIEIGGAIYPTVSLTNHSCCPNSVRYSVQGKVCVLRATRFISKGCEIFDNYGPSYLTQNLDERQSLLNSQYKFVCDCPACENSWSQYPHSEGTTTILCPESKCRQPASLLKKRKNQCNICGEVKKFEVLTKEFQIKLNQFGQNLKLVNSSNVEKAFRGLVEVQKFLDLNSSPPGKVDSDCQEAIKKCFSLMSVTAPVTSG